jgi:ubiquinone/menaquinone biosynthesis C-methylase UbiE
MANSWDTPEKIALSAHYADRIRSHLKSKNPAKILEVGCGTGLLGANFLNETSTLLGVDTSKGMLDVFNEKFKGLKARSVLLNLEEEELHENNFDLIISSMAFHHLKNPAAMINKLKKLLAPGGAIAVIDLDAEDGTFHPDPANMGVFHFGFSDETTRSWGSSAEFKDYSREIVHNIEKNDKLYPLFLAIFLN